MALETQPILQKQNTDLTTAFNTAVATATTAQRERDFWRLTTFISLGVAATAVVVALVVR